MADRVSGARSSKRLRIISAITGYVLLGIPVWWYTTSISRPLLPGKLILQLEDQLNREAHMLPVQLTIYMISHDGCTSMAQGLAEDVWRRLQSEAAAGQLTAAKLNLRVSVTVEDTTSHICRHATWPGTKPEDHHTRGICLSFSKQATLWSMRDGPKLDAALQSAVATAGASQPGQYFLFVLPKATSKATHGLHSAASVGDGTVVAGSISSQHNSTATAFSGAPGGSSTATLVPSLSSDFILEPQQAIAPVIGQHRSAWLTYSPDDSCDVVLDRTAQVATDLLLHVWLGASGVEAVQAAKQLPISSARETLLSFSLCNADPTLHHYSWDFDAFEQRYMTPLQDALSLAVTLQIESQVLYYTPARINGTWSTRHQAYVLRQRQLPFFVDSDWNLGSGQSTLGKGVGPGALVTAGGPAEPYAETCGSVRGTHSDTNAAGREQGGPVAPPAEDGPSDHEASPRSGKRSAVCRTPSGPHRVASHVLHFALYIPPPSQRPLLILGNKPLHESNEADGEGSGAPPQELLDSFWVPLWGGVHIMNPPHPPGISQRPATSPPPGAAVATVHDAVHAGLTGAPDAAAGVAAAAAPEPQVEAARAPVLPGAGAAAAKAPTSSAPHSSQLPDTAMDHFVSAMTVQLRQLLGLASPADLATRVRGGVQVLPPTAAGLAAWEVDGLARRRTAADISAAASLLAALSRLAQTLPNLEMPVLIGRQVNDALAAIEAALHSTRAGQYAKAAATAGVAHAAAEAAFSNPAVLTQLNFPESHKLGIYMPLFLPASLPLMQSLVAEVRRYFRRRRVRWTELQPALLAREEVASS